MMTESGGCCLLAGLMVGVILYLLVILGLLAAVTWVIITVARAAGAHI